MGMPELERAFDLIRAAGDEADVVGPRTPELVAAAERALGLTFPPTYRRYLLEMGVASLNGFEAYGVIGDDFENSRAPDAIWLTLQLRRGGMPHALVAVGEDGMGGCYVLDTSRADASGECPVVVWEPGGSEPGDELEHLAGDFGTFVWDHVQADDW